MKDPYRSDKRNYEQRQGYSDVERERYLEKLRVKTERRYNTRILRNMAIAVGEEQAVKASQKHLQSIDARTEFRARVKQTVIESHKAHEQLHRKLGQLYRERLTWFVSRSLEHAATARIEYDNYDRSRHQLQATNDRQSHPQPQPQPQRQPEPQPQSQRVRDVEPVDG